MADDDLRFGDLSSSGGPPQGPVEKMQMIIELALQGMILLVVLYALVAILDSLMFNGALPIV